MATPKSTRAQRFSLVVADIFELAGRLRREGDVIAREHGQTQARWQVLSVISDGMWTVPRIAERLGITRQGVQRVADELHEGALARYESNAQHARSPFLVLTGHGKHVLGAITESSRAFNDRLGAVLGECDLRATHAALGRLLAQLRVRD